MKKDYMIWYDALNRQQRHDLKVKHKLKVISSAKHIHELYIKENAPRNGMSNDKFEAIQRMVASHLKKQFCTDGEVSKPSLCAMVTPEGTIQMIAHKLHDTHKDAFWVAVEKYEVL